MSERSILVVEDDRDIRDTIRDLLETEGYTVFSAPHGRAGIEILTQNKPSLILLDLNMPVMNGWEMLKELQSREDFESIPVIILSASGLGKKPEGATALFQKPIDLSRLLEATEKYCQEGTLH